MKKILLMISLSVYTIFGGLAPTTIVANEQKNLPKQVISTIIFPKAYGMSYDANGGEGIPPVRQTVNEGESYTVRDQWLLKRQGYFFDGWNSAADGSGTAYQPDDIIVVTKKIIFYAQWKAIPTVETYTVTFESNGGTAVTAIENITTGSNIVMPTAPTKVNHTFVGWYTDAGLTAAWNFETDVVTESITLYAKWVQDAPVETFSVIFESNEGTAVTTIEDVVAGTRITAPAVPTKVGYTFVGWYKTADLTSAWDFAKDVVTEPITLYAKWAPEVTTGGNNSENKKPSLPKTGELVSETLLLGSASLVGGLGILYRKLKK